MKKIINTYRRLLKNLHYTGHRYIFDDFNINNRLTGLIGPRGTGKTTLLLQYIKEKLANTRTAIYVSVDNIYFTQNNLVDFVDELYEVEGIKYFFFDEIHKYKNWNQELKNIHDSYPDVKIIFSGSSSLDLIKGTYDLSRRGILYKLEGLSFREYLKFKGIADIDPVNTADLVSGNTNLESALENIDRVRGHFKDYLLKGYYPYLFEDPAAYYQKVANTIDKTIYEDISSYYSLKTENLIYLKKIIAYTATIPPGELNRNSIAKNIGLDNKTVQKYLTILNETGIITLLRENNPGSNLLKSTEKIYLNNPDIYHAVADDMGYAPKTGTIREIFFINMLLNSGNKIFYSKIGDFEVNHMYFEVGGKNKSKTQIKNNLENSFLVKDDIIYREKNVIPLIFFGFLY